MTADPRIPAARTPEGERVEIADVGLVDPILPAERVARVGVRSILIFAVPLILIAAICFSATLLPIDNPNAQDLGSTLKPPVLFGGTWAHPLGTDQLGRDLLSRMIWGGQLTIIIGLLGALVAIVPGALIGMAAGFSRGKLDGVVSQLISAQLALPFVLVALAIIVAQGSSLGIILFVLAITGWAPCARVVRADALSLRERQFVLALRASGIRTPGILMRHILPNLMGTVVVLATLQIGAAILVESALSFLGVGVVPPHVSWGLILASGRENLADGWWISTFPGIAITVVVLFVNLLGDALLVNFDPRKKQY